MSTKPQTHYVPTDAEYKRAYDIGYAHGNQREHPYKPPADLFISLIEAYASGFDAGIDDLGYLNRQSKTGES